MTVRRRAGHVVFATAALAISFLLVTVPSSSPVSAATVTQSAGCFNPIASKWSTVPVKVSATAPATATAGGPVTLSGTTFETSIASADLEQGVHAGAIPPGSNSVVLTVNLALVGTGTTPATRTATGSQSLGFTVAVDPVTEAVTLTPDPVTGVVSLADTSWTTTGDSAAFSVSHGTAPATSFPTLAERGAAPIQMLGKLNGTLNANLYCWPGTANAAGTALVPGATPTIATIGSPSTTTTTAPAPTTTVPAPTTTTPGPTTTAPKPPASPNAATPQSDVPAFVSGSGEYATVCSSEVLPDKPQLPFTVTATAPSHAEAGSPVTLSDQTWSVTIPGSVIDPGVQLGLLEEGAFLEANITPAIAATNTVERVRSAAPVALKSGPVELDDVTGQASDVVSTFPVPDMTWTASGEEVAFAMADIKVEVMIGTSGVVFTCAPSTDRPFLKTSPDGGTAAVLGAQNSGGGGSLANTGVSIAPELFAAAGLIDVGYLLLSAARPACRRRL